MQLVLFTFVIAEHLFVSAVDSDKLKLLQIFFTLLPRCRKHQMWISWLWMWTWPAHQKKCYSKHSQFIGNGLLRLSAVVFTCLGLMNAVLFLSSVPFAQKLSGKGNPLLWSGSWLCAKGKYLHQTRDPWTVIVAQTLHPHTLW